MKKFRERYNLFFDVEPYPMDWQDRVVIWGCVIAIAVCGLLLRAGVI